MPRAAAAVAALGEKRDDDNEVGLRAKVAEGASQRVKGSRQDGIGANQTRELRTRVGTTPTHIMNRFFSAFFSVLRIADGFR